MPPVPTAHIVGLLSFPETERVTLETVGGDSAGETSRGALRQDSHADVQQYHSSGLNGEKGSNDTS